MGNVESIYNNSFTKVAWYTYDAYGNYKADGAPVILAFNHFTYRGYYYDEDLGLYYLQTRYYDSTTARFINADNADCIGLDGTLLSYNLFAYCMNDPVNRFDSNGNWSLPNWAKVVIGATATVAAVVVTVATGGAVLPILISVATSTAVGAGAGAIRHRITTGSWDGAGESALDGAADGFMTGGLFSLGSSVIGGILRTVKNAKAGITIGKTGEFEQVAELANTRRYTGLKEFKFIQRIRGTKIAEKIGWFQNKCIVKGVMMLKGAIYDCGGALTGAYAKEVALTKGYQYLFNVWLM